MWPNFLCRGLYPTGAKGIYCDRRSEWDCENMCRGVQPHTRPELLSSCLWLWIPPFPVARGLKWDQQAAWLGGPPILAAAGQALATKLQLPAWFETREIVVHTGYRGASIMHQRLYMCLMPRRWITSKSNSWSCSSQCANCPSGSLKFCNHESDPWSVLKTNLRPRR